MPDSKGKGRIGDVSPDLIKFNVTESSGAVSALLLRPPAARWMYVFGHGAGAGMRHPFMESVARTLAGNGIATFRYQFPYMEKRSKRPDAQSVLLATIRAAVAAAVKADGSLPLFAGGKSMGGRMTSLALSESPMNNVKGLVFFGFPLHPPETPGTERSKHLENVAVPMLFLQGTRDKLADLSLMTEVCDRLGSRATLHIVEGGDHSFHVPKSSGISDAEVIAGLGGVVRDWFSALT